MTRKTIANFKADIEVVLEDTAYAVFPEATITDAIEAGIVEISQVVPDEVFHWMTTRNYSKYIDISTWRDYIINPLHVVYPFITIDTDGYLISDKDLDRNRRNIEEVGDTIRMFLDSPPIASATDDLTGTVTTTASSTAVTGSGTLFTTELRPGNYIYSGSHWYRVASISSATALVLANSVETADAGADTSMSYWRNDVVLRCTQYHYLEGTQTDFAGAVKGATAKGAWSIIVDALGTGTMAKNMTFTIAGVDGIYRITADATIATNEATLYIEPALLGIAPDNAVVTFYGSSLTPQLEGILIELVAGRLLISKAISYINTVNVGSANASQEYEAKGQRYVASAIGKLIRLKTPKVSHLYAR